MLFTIDLCNQLLFQLSAIYIDIYAYLIHIKSVTKPNILSKYSKGSLWYILLLIASVLKGKEG